MGKRINLFEYILAKELTKELPVLIDDMMDCKNRLSQPDYMKYKNVAEIVNNLTEAVFRLESEYQAQRRIKGRYE